MALKLKKPEDRGHDNKARREVKAALIKVLKATGYTIDEGTGRRPHFDDISAAMSVRFSGHEGTHPGRCRINLKSHCRTSLMHYHHSQTLEEAHSIVGVAVRREGSYRNTVHRRRKKTETLEQFAARIVPVCYDKVSDEAGIMLTLKTDKAAKATCEQVIKDNEAAVERALMGRLPGAHSIRFDPTNDRKGIRVCLTVSNENFAKLADI